MKFKICLFLCCAIHMIQSAQVIIMMGPSCAGKSTLSKCVCALLNTKEKEWVVVDFDEVGENIENLIKVTNEYLAKNINIIIDTNTYEYEMEKEFIGVNKITKIIVTAPLGILLQRDDKRTRRLKRDAKRAFWCRDFIMESYNNSLMWPSDLIIDSSQQSISDSCDIILCFLQTCLMLRD